MTKNILKIGTALALIILGSEVLFPDRGPRKTDLCYEAERMAAADVDGHRYVKAMCDPELERVLTRR